MIRVGKVVQVSLDILVSTPYRGEASIKYMVVHNVNSSVEICLLSIDLYGQNKLLNIKYFFLPSAGAPPKLNVASRRSNSLVSNANKITRSKIKPAN